MLEPPTAPESAMNDDTEILTEALATAEQDAVHWRNQARWWRETMKKPADARRCLGNVRMCQRHARKIRKMLEARA